MTAEILKREILWNINFGEIVYLLTLFLIAIAAYVFWKHYRILKQGKKENRFDHLWERLKGVLIYGFGQKRIYSDRYAGIMHFLIFSGIVVLFVGSGLLGLKHFGIEITGNGYLAYSFIMDVFGLMLIVGIIMALWRRCVIKPKKLETTLKDLTPLLLLLGVGLTGFLVEAARIAVDFPAFEVWSPIGWNIALLLDGLAKAQILLLHKIFWWLHMALAFLLMGYVVYSKLLHAVLAPLNIFFRSLKEPGALEVLEFKKGVKDFGLKTAQDLSWKDRLDLCVCAKIKCGSCEESCPAFISGKPLSPKKFIKELKDLSSNEPSKEFFEAIPQEEIWACTTCRFCETRCPVFVEHLPKIVGLRRYSFLTKNRYPKELINAIKSIRADGNPYGAGKDSRADWREGNFPKVLSPRDEVEILFWVGCAGAFDDRVKKVAKCLANVLKDAGISFGILGNEEKCCGQWLRVLGDDFDSQMLAKKNTETLKNYKFKKIVTFCPHCLQALKNDYSNFGGNFEVLHHSQLLEQFIKEGRIKLPPATEKAITATYHDPCYLSRYPNIYEPPRRILKFLGLRLKEMPLSRERSFCCGAGGGRNWLEETPETRVNRIRAKQAEETGADIAVTACPFCLGMFEEGLTAKESKMKVFDLAELVK